MPSTMSTAAVSPKPAFVPTLAPVDVEAAIARYVDRAFERLCRALLDSAPTFGEPVTTDPDRARARATLLVETLAGFAIGNVVGHVAIVAKRAVPEARDAIDRALGQFTRARANVPEARATTSAPGDRSTSAVLTVVPAWLSPVDAERAPLLERLVSHLHVRLCLAGAAARALLGAIANACGDRARFAAALTDDSTIALAFIDQLELGWRFFTAITEGLPDPVIDDGPRWRRARDLWPAWSRRVRGVVERREVEIDCGHILRILTTAVS